MTTELTPLEVGAKLNARRTEEEANFDFNKASQYRMSLTGKLMGFESRLADAVRKHDSKMIAKLTKDVARTKEAIAAFDAK